MRDEVAREIERTLAPAIRAEGGEVELVDVTPDGIVRIRLSKAWAASPALAAVLRWRTIGGHF